MKGLHVPYWIITKYYLGALLSINEISNHTSLGKLYKESYSEYPMISGKNITQWIEGEYNIQKLLGK